LAGEITNQFSGSIGNIERSLKILNDSVVGDKTKKPKYPTFWKPVRFEKKERHNLQFWNTIKKFKELTINKKTY